MFYNLRYLAVLIYCLVIVLALFLGIYFKSYVAENILKVSAHREAVSLANAYKQNVWNRYYPVIGFLMDQPQLQLETYPQYLAFAADTKAFFTNSRLVKVAIYTAKGEIYKSNDGSLTENHNLFQKWFVVDRVQQALQKAKSDHTTTTTLLYSVTSSLHQGKNLAIIKGYAPLKADAKILALKSFANKTDAIIEVNFDVTREVRALEIVQMIMVALIIVFFGVICVLIFIVVHRAERAIEKQQEASSELATAKDSAEQENKQKSKFLANVSHELRTPLNAIIGFSEIISTESMGPIENEQYKEFIKDIHTSGLHLLSLINDILDFSKAEEDKLEVLFEDVDLTKVIKISLRMVLPRAEQSKVNLQEVLPEEHLILKLDSKRIKQVLLNLLSNAVKFTAENGTVTIKASKNPTMSACIIEVSDTGVGMEPQDIARALAPFGQVDNKLSRRYEGTGLGLPLTKKLVELMKGKFEIKSEVGMGTTISLSFPIVNEQEGISS